MTQLPDEKAGKYATPVDVSECDHEPIHVPGSIQPHGVQLVLDDTDLRIMQASSNTKELVGVEPTDLLGQPLELLLRAEQIAALVKVISDRDSRPITAVRLEVEHEHRAFNGIPHRHRGILFLELEPVGSTEDASLARSQKIQAVLSLMQSARSTEELLRTVVTEVRGVIGYDRVMVYRFDRAGHGEVIAEEVSNDHERFLGLHYPASDIPQQARMLYTLNCIRHIPDVNYRPAELIPLIYPSTRELTDMSHATLRSVSPVHVEYLQNMGVQASMSISIMVGGKLWGLIACHHYTPKFIPFEMRVACGLIGEVVSLAMAALESEAQTRYKTVTNGKQAAFLDTIGAQSDLGVALLERAAALLEYIPCEGCAIGVGD